MLLSGHSLHLADSAWWKVREESAELCSNRQKASSVARSQARIIFTCKRAMVMVTDIFDRGAIL
jgi:hypothetical protein